MFTTNPAQTKTYMKPNNLQMQTIIC